MHVQEPEAILTEAESTMDHANGNMDTISANGKIDTASANIVAKDPLIYNALPPITTLHGISASWSSRILPDF